MTVISEAKIGLIKDQPMAGHAAWLAEYVISDELISCVQTHCDEYEISM